MSNARADDGRRQADDRTGNASASYEVPRKRKIDALTRILDAETPSLAMIFCRTKMGVDELGEALLARGYRPKPFMAISPRRNATASCAASARGQAEILIATDVAARGLDIPDVTHVINLRHSRRAPRPMSTGSAAPVAPVAPARRSRWSRRAKRAGCGRSNGSINARIEPRRLPTLADVAERRVKC